MNPKLFCSEPGYDSFLALTYSLDLIFFETVVLPQLSAGGVGEAILIADRDEIANTMSRQAEHIRRLGRHYVLTPSLAKGRQHAKILLRMGKSGALLWVGSGNLSSGGWGSNDELGTAWRVEANDGAGMRDVRRILEVAKSLTDGQVRESITSLLASLEVDEDAAGGERILISGADGTLAAQIGRRWPGRRFRRARMRTGSTDEQGALLRHLHEAFGVEEVAIALDPASSDFVAQRLEALPLRVGIVSLPRQPHPHAKFLFLDGEEGSAALLGSANCSAAAWLVPVTAGGNTEAVVVYDQIEEARCAEALAPFASPAVPPTAAALRGPNRKEEAPSSDRELTLYELVAQEHNGRVRVRLSHPVEGALSAALDFGGLLTPLEPSDGTLVSWSGPTPDLPNVPGTRFGSVVIQTSEGTVRSALRWLDEEDVLHGWRTRRSADAVGELGRPRQGRAEYSRIREQVSEVASAIFSDTGSFPDPAPTRRPTTPTIAGASDPDALLRNIADIAHNLGPPAAYGGSYWFGLSGVLRVLFPERDLPPEPAPTPELVGEGTPQGGAPQDNGPEPEPPVLPPSPPPPPPPEQEKAKLVAQMEEFFRRLATPEFEASCTSRQLVQAIAFPLAVAAKGLEGGWIDIATANEWTLRAADYLLELSPAGSASYGLLERVRTRYGAEGRAETFEQVVGDGMLWAALSGALLRTAKGAEPSLRRALALRDVFDARLLVASASPTRLAQLLTSSGDGRSLALMEQSQKAATAVRALEVALKSLSQALLGRQIGYTTQVDDPIWKPEIGFGRALEPVRIASGAKMLASLQRRPGTPKILMDRFVDLRIAAELSREMQVLLEDAKACSV